MVIHVNHLINDNSRPRKNSCSFMEIHVNHLINANSRPKKIAVKAGMGPADLQ